MDFKLTDEQQLLLKNLKELLERECPESYLAECDAKHEWPARGWKALGENGYLGLGIDEKYGGTPSDALTQVLVTEVIARYAFPLANYYSGSFMLCHDLELFASEEQKAEVIPQVVRGDITLGVSITEPQAGSDDSAMTTTTRFEGDKVIINGQKTWASNADRAKYMVLLTRDLENPNPYKAVSMWLLPTDTPGLTIVPIPKMGCWTLNSCEMFLDNVVLPKSALLGELNNGWKQLMTNFGFERAIIGAVCLGLAQAALDDASTYANQRVQFGNVIGSYQHVQRRIADMALRVELLRNLTYKVAAMVDDHQPIRVEAAMIKLYGSTAAQASVDDCMQVMGGVGYMTGSRVTRNYRDVRMMRIGGGTDEMMYNAIAPMVLKQYK